MNRILILSHAASDLSDLILANCPGSVLMSPDDSSICMDRFDAVCVLAGIEDAPYMIPAIPRCAIEQMRTAGKPVFTEFCGSMGGCYMDTPDTMSHHRMAYMEGGLQAQGLSIGDILDGHYNDCINYVFIPKDAAPILLYHPYLCAHDHVNMTDEELRKGKWALFRMDASTIVCGTRICNFRRARLAPAASWEAILTGIISHLAGEAVTLTFPAPVCTFAKGSTVTCAADTAQAVAKGLAWYSNADMMIDGGARGFREGLSHHIYAKNGKQLRANIIRNDCTGEAGGAFLLDSMVTGNAASRAIYDAANHFGFNYLQVKDGLHKGMMRWSEQAWETCYQDDVARVLIPPLLEANFAGSTAHWNDIVDALDYLVKTTGTDGLRVGRTDIPNLTQEKMEKLASSVCGFASAHYNAFYHAALLLAYRAGGPKHYLEVAEAGLSAIMSRYPDTDRETSETEEVCRMILPLAILYQVTGSEEHKSWLYRLTNDLQLRRHPSGGYAEWDTGYQANCSRREAGECALLAENGDPVADLLYSVNWLPLGFAYAYLATGDTMFHDLWNSVASFFVSCQIHSEDPTLDGAWTRAFDMDRWEIYGVPHDVGWAPCCVESGWTVGEILMGLQFMHIAEKLVK